jgi:TonB family protein
MRNLEACALSYLLNSMWQVPLLFFAGFLAARVVRPISAAAEHRAWVLTLVSQSLLPAISIVHWTWLSQLFLWGRHVSSPEQAYVSVVMGAGIGLATLQIPDGALTLIAVCYCALCLYFSARFAWRGANLSVLRRDTVAVHLAGKAAGSWAQCVERYATGNVAIAASPRIFGPVTMGLRRKLILLPVSMVGSLPEAELVAVIAHEFAHLQRRDFFKNLWYELLSIPVSYHPVFWLTRRNLMESREIVCDRMASQTTGRNEYARSLLRLASLLIKAAPVRTHHAIGIFDANTFERRIMKLAEQQKEVRGIRRVAILACCGALAIGTGGSVVGLALHVDAAESGHATAAGKPPTSLNVSQSVMAENLLSKAVPHYPESAKKAKIQGKVALGAVIGKDGNIKNLRVLSGPRELQQSALDAVRQWVYRPYLLNGDPVEVKTTINVIYSLQG